MIAIKLLFGLLLCLIPFLFHFTKDLLIVKAGGKVIHWQGAFVVIMASTTVSAITTIYHISQFYEMFLLLISFHYLVFDYSFNSLVLNRHWSYLGSNFLDRIEKKIPPKVLFLLKLSLFGLAICNYL